jgi:hypothetical protein
MPVIPTIETSNSIDQWRQIDNQVINAINNEAINQIIQIVDPLNDQDMLVYQASGPNAGFFINVSTSAFVSAIIADLAEIPTNNILPYFLSQGVRTLF